jgi:hypothetical protein
LLVAAQTGCEAIFPIDRFMGESDASSVFPPSIEAGEIGLSPPPDLRSHGGMDGFAATWAPSPPLAGLIDKGIVFVGDMMESDAGLRGAATAACTQNGTGVVSVVALNPAGTKGTFHPGAIGDVVMTATP